MSRDRPINADVPASVVTAQAPSEDPPPPPKKRRRSLPTALKMIVLLVVIAIGFIVAAVLGGSSGSKSAESAAPAPSGRIAGEGQTIESAEQLGYPSFATDNTTRVGGSDPASNAAAVALAAFPSTTPAQRPAAVTLVGEDDWAGAIAAAVLMAPPVRAPLLFSGSGGSPDATAEALAALSPEGAKSTGGAAAFLVGDVAAPDGLGKATKVRSGSPAATAASIARLRDRLFGEPPAHIVVAPANEPEFAAPAAAWAARSGDPVLYAAGDEVPKPTASFLKSHRKAPVYVLGPSSAISSAAVRAIARIDPKVHRVSGEDPVSNAIAFARYANGGFGWNVNDPGHGFVLARGDAPLDAAAAAPLSASGTWGPLLLTDSAGTLPAALREYFLDVKPGYTTDPTRAFYNHVWVIGDQEAIDVNQQAKVNELAEVAKIGGEP